VLWASVGQEGERAMKPGRYWRQLTAAQYAALYPAKPPALRKIAFTLRRLGALGHGSHTYQSSARLSMGNQVFTLDERRLAKACGVSVRTLQRYLPLFESYGILEVKRWRYRKHGGSPSSYRVFLGNVIPPDWTYGGGKYPISAVERRKKKD